MILDIARLLLFPALMAFAAASDLFTMTISNRVSLALAAGFLALAVLSGMGFYEILAHVGAGAAVLTAAFACFAMGSATPRRGPTLPVVPRRVAQHDRDVVVEQKADGAGAGSRPDADLQPRCHTEALLARQQHGRAVGKDDLGARAVGGDRLDHEDVAAVDADPLASNAGEDNGHEMYPGLF